MELERLMWQLAESGVTVVLKADHERFAEGGPYWTLFISGSRLGDDGPVHADEGTLKECLTVGLTRLLERGPEWTWVKDFMA